jgi:hypothetical protein
MHSGRMTERFSNQNRSCDGANYQTGVVHKTNSEQFINALFLNYMKKCLRVQSEMEAIFPLIATYFPNYFWDHCGWGQNNENTWPELCLFSVYPLTAG